MPDWGRQMLSIRDAGFLAELRRRIETEQLDVMRVDRHRRTPLHWAASESGPPIIRLLVESGVDINAVDNHGDTALHLAIPLERHCLNLPAVATLIELGADVNAQNKEGRTALLEASKAGYEYVVEMLLGANANIEIRNKKGRTALWHAVSHHHEDVVEMLLDAGARVDIADKNGETPIARVRGSVKAPLRSMSRRDMEMLTMLEAAARKRGLKEMMTTGNAGGGMQSGSTL